MKKMTLSQHFAELRRRILWGAAVFVGAFLLGMMVAPWIQQCLTWPLMNIWSDGILLYTGLADGLMINFSLAGLFALLITLPFGLWQLWMFVEPGLKKNERRFIWPVLVLSPGLFLLGAGFAFFVLFPVVFKFFVELNQVAPVPSVLMPAVRDYLGFAIGMLKVFGIAFQLPLVLVLLNRIEVLKKNQMIAARRYAIILIVVVAAILTPPDIVSQLLLAIPMWLLFEISILCMRHD
ncbi:MAG: twin-arginine translocase subunit TatC [Alphaproteobacteria bacterium]|nr:twin-arginine translocase subunit TatC [Alphaproteobacteria bacterium]